MLDGTCKSPHINNLSERTHVESLVGRHVRYEYPIYGAISGDYRGERHINGVVEAIGYSEDSAPFAIIVYDSVYGIKTYDYPLASWVLTEAEVL